MQYPKISVIVPVYNVEAYLPMCIESIINQTYKNLEIILINDGSPDKCYEICESFAKRDARIKVIHQENKGLSGARNTGLDYATGDYIAFVDSDDWIDRDMYFTLINFMTKNKLTIVECDVYETSDENIGSKSGTKVNKAKAFIESSIETYKRVIEKTTFSVWRRIYKTELIKDYTFRAGKISEDVYFTIDNLCHSSKIGYYKYPFYNYRNNPESITRKKYSPKDFDALEAALYLYDTMISRGYKDDELNIIVKKHLLKRLLRHYRLLNENPHVDKDFKFRKETKKMIDLHYDNTLENDIKLKLAKYLNIRLFYFLVFINKIRRKLI